MREATCSPCLKGRHGFRCEDRETCACSVCAARPTAVVPPAIRRPVQRPGTGGGAPGYIRGSTLPTDLYVAVGALLEEGWTLSGISKEIGISRDQVRTVKRYRDGFTSRGGRRRGGVETRESSVIRT